MKTTISFLMLVGILYYAHLISDQHDLFDSPKAMCHITMRPGTTNPMRTDDAECPNTPELKAFYAKLNAESPFKTIRAIKYAEIASSDRCRFVEQVSLR